MKSWAENDKVWMIKGTVAEPTPYQIANFRIFLSNDKFLKKGGK